MPAQDRDVIYNFKETVPKDKFDILPVFVSDHVRRIDDETPFAVNSLPNRY